MGVVASLMEAAYEGRSINVELINYTKSKVIRRIDRKVQREPISTSDSALVPRDATSSLYVL